MEKPLVITRYASPTILDTAQKGTLCKVFTGFDVPCTFYIQISSNEELPNWVKLEANTEEEARKELI
jgi:hypothetical protein